MTYSAAVLDSGTGQLLVGVQSCHPAVGAVVPHVLEGVGAVLTQARGEPTLAVAVLDRLAGGAAPETALDEVLAHDRRREERQIAVLAQDGRAAAFTGACCVPHAAHVVGDGFVVASNLAATQEVVARMAAAVQLPGPAMARVFAALDAAQDAGGDLRGLLSAAFVAGASSRGTGLQRLEVRIDVSDTPLQDVQRAAREMRAFQVVAAAAQEASPADAPRLVAEVRAFTDDPQTLFWFALDVLADRLGDVGAAARLLIDVMAVDTRWRTVLDRMPTEAAQQVRQRLDAP